MNAKQPLASQMVESQAVASRVARWIVYGAVVYILLMSILFIALIVIGKIDRETMGMWKDVVGFSVPVFAAWVGTILAYYFSKENFEAANRNVQEMVTSMSGRESLRGISAEAVMVPRGSIQGDKLEPQQTAKDFLVKNVLPKFQGKISRWAFFNANDSILCIIHESTAYKFFHQERDKNRQDTTTVQDLIDDKQLGTQVKALAFVPERASLVVAQDEMNKVNGCQDVFVTKGGGRDEPVLGWLTNADIAKKAVT
jgi:hypothetical protein